MYLALFLLAYCLVFGPQRVLGKGPATYKYIYEVRDTTKHRSSFSMFTTDNGNFTDGRNVQLRSIGNGEYTLVIDNASPVFQAQLGRGQLQGVSYFPHGKKQLTGLTASLRKIYEVKKTKYTAYEIILSKKRPKGNVGFRGWSLFDPEGTDGVYTVAAGVGNVADTFLFSLCKRDNGKYYQIEYAQSNSQKLVTPPKGCYRTELYSTLAPPSAKAV